MKRKGNRSFVAIDHIKDLNELKTVLAGKYFTKSLFQNELKKIHIPSNNIFWSGFLKYSLIKRISKEHFIFIDNKPIHYQLLENIYSDYYSRLKEYTHNSEVKKVKREQDSKITEAVKFLKSLGYEIYAPSGDLYSKL